MSIVIDHDDFRLRNDGKSEVLIIVDRSVDLNERGWRRYLANLIDPSRAAEERAHDE